MRAKAKIRDQAIPYEIPAPAELPARLESVLRVGYLIFNEGYAAAEGPSPTRDDLCGDAIRLGRLLVELLDEPEAPGLLALILLHEARRRRASTGPGDIILLEDQDRSKWDSERIAEAQGLLERTLGSRQVGSYLSQAAIAGVHVEAPSVDEIDWVRIVELYDLLLRIDPSPVAALNRAVALGMRDGPEAALAGIEAVLREGDLDDYHLAHAARADIQRRLGLAEAARASYQRALELARQPADRRFLQARLAQLAVKRTTVRD
ncbi:MAG: polymerase, sigma subunit, family [Rhodospirillales bacterium]|nr:polymerase, sigma subunit, family [Rhodospirillales bacterium]